MFAVWHYLGARSGKYHLSAISLSRANHMIFHQPNIELWYSEEAQWLLVDSHNCTLDLSCQGQHICWVIIPTLVVKTKIENGMLPPLLLIDYFCYYWYNTVSTVILLLLFSGLLLFCTEQPGFVDSLQVYEDDFPPKYDTNVTLKFRCCPGEIHRWVFTKMAGDKSWDR